MRLTGSMATSFENMVFDVLDEWFDKDTKNTVGYSF